MTGRRKQGRNPFRSGISPHREREREREKGRWEERLLLLCTAVCPLVVRDRKWKENIKRRTKTNVY